MDEIRKQYEAHMQKAYPNAAHIDGADLELLDGTIVGRTVSFLGSSNGLEQYKIAALKHSLAELQDKQGVIPEEAKEYFVELQNLGERVLAQVKSPSSM